ncbi:HNH endonuclease [Bacillus sp. FJAT-29790]|nr:HNH endonuclease [Bacillus sp. FJAT-29790]
MYLGTVYSKLHDYDLAKEIWPPKDKNSAVFEYIYFLIDVQKINIDGNEFNNLLEYGGSPRGFNTIASERIDKLVDQFGSVEKALESLMGKQRITSQKIVMVEMIEDDNFLSDIENTQQPSPKEDDKPKEKPNRISGGNSNGKWKRDASVALRAIMDADYKCEVNSSHSTFTSKATKKPYVEAHHLIPMHTQELFDNSIDVTANIVSLCPNCHRILHHALMNEKQHLLELLYNERKERLKNCNIKISKRDLISFYN